MGLFQKSVLNKHKKLQDKKAIEKAYKKYSKYFHNPKIQQNIRESKEEQYQEGFLRELFVNIFDYTINPNPDFNLTTELKNEKGAKKADGAIVSKGHDPLAKPFAIAVIELKGTKTKDLESIRQQAFDYKANQSGCVYVITSNFEKLRFYINNAVEFEEFNLFTLDLEQFELLYLCLHKENLLQNLPLKIKTDSIVAEEKITKTFYADYSVFKRELFRDLVKNNIKNEVYRDELQKEDNERATKDIKLSLFKKSQKLIDRFLFIFFAEDKGLLPPNSTLQILNKWKSDLDFGDERPLYNLFKQYFTFLETGRQGTQSRAEIFAYNGGLFMPDPILDSLIIDDGLLHKHTKRLSDYDFESQVGVNILGHIFENSLNEIESVNAEIEGQEFDKQKTKRKKDGVFYTPKYITKYIVDNTVGKLCEEKKDEIDIVEAEYQKSRKGRKTDTIKKLKSNLDIYRNWLLELTILDPACGSGAFLNQALDFLIREHKYIDELETALLGGGIVFRNIENTILEKNIYGVDLNEESVEIAKLSLWLRTAQPRRKLNTLNNNIKCGNSLIDDPKVAGDKAFNWQAEFPHVFKGKEKNAYHITTATHDSRTSQRMIDYKVRELRDNGTRPKAEGIWLAPEDEVLITKTIAEIVKEDNLNVMAFNVCGDHIHMLLVCEEEAVSKIVQKIKAKTSRIVNINKGITTTREHAPLSDSRGEKQNSLWTQKFGNTPIKDEEHLWNTVEYIKTNREKHELPLHGSNKGTCPLVEIINDFCCSYEHAFRTETTGGFDVVIGNPPYGAKFSKIEIKFYNKYFIHQSYQLDSFLLFTENIKKWLKDNGIGGLIMPNTWLSSLFGSSIRQFVLNDFELTHLIHYDYFVFDDATVETDTYILRNSKPDKTTIIDLVIVNKNKQETKRNLSQKDWIDLNGQPINIYETNEVTKVKKRLSKLTKLGEIVQIVQGTKPFQKGKGKPKQTEETMELKPFVSEIKKDESFVPLLRGSLISKYSILWKNDYWISFGDWLAEPRYTAKFDSKEKLIIRQTGDSLLATYDNQQFIARDNLYVIRDDNDVLNLKGLLAILNSKFLNWFFQNIINPERGKAMAQVKSGHLQQLPIADSKFDNLSPLTDKMLELNSELQDTLNKFKYIKSQYLDLGYPKKLQNWHKLDFGEFIKELNKAIKKQNKAVATATTRGHVPLPLLTKTDEMEWMDVFETKKAEAQTLKAAIDKTDKEIDQMVYELYELTPEEIAIVENSTNG